VIASEVDGLGERIEHIDTRLGGRIDHLAARMDAMDERLTARMDTLQGAVADIGARLTALEQR